MVVIAVAGCTSRGEPPEAEPEARDVPVETPTPDNVPTVDFGPLIGGELRLATPTAGRYAVQIRAGQTRFISMEMRIDDSLDGGASLELRPDGSAHACFWSNIHGSGSISRYASDDGLDHHNEHTDVSRLGARGTWVAEPGSARATVRLQAFEHRTCEPGADAYEPPNPTEMICHALAANDALPVAAIVCRPPVDQHRIHDVSMALEPNPRTGPWLIREDSSARYPRAFGPEVQPWLLLGAPGLIIDASDRNEGKPMTIELSAGEVPTPTGVLEVSR